MHTFRKGSSCESVLSDMVNELEIDVYRRQYALSIFLDVKGTFNNLTVKASVHGMSSKDIPLDIIRRYTHYLKDRMVETTLKGIIYQRNLTRGTPQGGMLFSLVPNMAFNDLLNQFGKGPVKAKGCVDTAALVIKGHDVPSLIYKGEDAVSLATAFGWTNGMEFGSEKGSGRHVH